MTVYLENMLNEVQLQGVNTQKAQNIASSTGAYNFDYSLSTGTFKFPTGGVSGLTSTVVQSALVGATVVLTAAQSGGTFINRSTSGTPSWTLPAATTAGLVFTFICANTTAGFTVTGAQVIHAKTSATGTAITTTTTLTNTQATAVVGDAITIVSDGTAWWMTSQSGIFAAS